MMALVSTMYVLVLLDTAFSGVCAASGRNALIRKRSYYLRSMWHGALWGQPAILLGLLLVTVAVQLSTNKLQALEEAQIAIDLDLAAHGDTGPLPHLDSPTESSVRISDEDERTD